MTKEEAIYHIEGKLFRAQSYLQMIQSGFLNDGDENYWRAQAYAYEFALSMVKQIEGE